MFEAKKKKPNNNNIKNKMKIKYRVLNIAIKI
jgi:hypothetical protein